ncbi:gamma-glutamyl-gamma-aminobutyrate hydrolase family protein [Iningainema tapete]|uniref:Gamma-glutamyl-gamma-aminobutyrate hydrolase family protein n=1 Tax=Iningainema tapete BLCC-T55 TaxID=2748662 RepID=A0A8J6XFV3_9CYAN|nr:gamma-glutamyl-gamma-aminobutyrate hydrolase family protein [Iningainema tapete]MBD2772285.1 gamma-glutamyl-gamma-aminobutyrate hydrolase family protein [Iningainema tapete BLCC-T55]
MNKFTRPTIGITTFTQNEEGHYHITGTYVEIIRRHGGLPILLPPDEPEECEAILQIVDGLIFTGGGDLDPVTYNAKMHPTISGVNPQRDAFELKLAKLALSTDTPILGICRGIAVMNVATGGSLVTHIPDEFGSGVKHTGEPSESVQHQVQIEPHSRLASILGATDVTVVSLHHQAVRTVPPLWRIAAQAKDGVIEALEHKYHPWAFALQWHPELAADDIIQQRIFQALVEAARAKSASICA